MALITVFTPAYNRANTLGRTYASLKKQDSKNFVWLIIDDGSTDQTADLVKTWMAEEKEFEIRYEYKTNGGMHTAHNRAYELIDTELNVCIDSDDELADGAISAIEKVWNEKKKDEIAGIIGLDADLSSGCVIGTELPKEYELMTYREIYATGGKGDKKLVYRTDIMKALPPYPVFENEKYVYLSYKYVLADENYKMIPINKVLCNVEYQTDGSSNNMFRQYRRNPNGFMFLRKNNLKTEKGAKRLFKESIHYVSSCLLARKPGEILASPKKGLAVCAVPFGVMLYMYIMYKTTERK